MVLNPKAYEIEDTRINEYYINKAKQNFKSMIDYNMESEPRYEVALRKAIKDTLEITNVLFESYFGINADKDVFQYLIDEGGSFDQMKQTEEKFKLAALIREIKEKDIRSAVSLEKKWYQEILKHQKRYIKEKETDDSKKAQKELEALTKKQREMLELKRDQELLNLKEQLKKQSEAMNELKKKYQDLYHQEITRVNKKINDKKQKEKARLKLLKEKEQAQLKAKVQKEKEQQRLKLKAEKERLKKDHQKKVAKLKQKV
jgi:primosomal protein N'